MQFIKAGMFFMTGFLAFFGQTAAAAEFGLRTRLIPTNVKSPCVEAYQSSAQTDSDVAKTFQLFIDMADDYDWPSIETLVVETRHSLRMEPWKEGGVEDPLNVIVVNIFQSRLNNQSKPSNSPFDSSIFCQGKPWRIQRYNSWLIQQAVTKFKTDKGVQAQLGINPGDF
jgi:hypothetical protein